MTNKKLARLEFKLIGYTFVGNLLVCMVAFSRAFAGLGDRVTNHSREISFAVNITMISTAVATVIELFGAGCLLYVLVRVIRGKNDVTPTDTASMQSVAGS